MNMRKFIPFLLIILIVLALVSGCGKTTTNTSTGSLKIDDFIFCSEIAGDRDFIKRDDKTFSKDENVLIYTEVSNLTPKDVSGKFEYWPVVEVEVKDPQGNSIIQRQKIIDEKLEISTKAPYLYFPITLTFPADSPDGKYEVTAYFEDMNSGREAQMKDNFFLE